MPCLLRDADCWLSASGAVACLSAAEVLVGCTCAGVMYPSTGLLSKQKGAHIAKFGPLQSWAMVPAGDSYQARFSTRCFWNLDTNADGGVRGSASAPMQVGMTPGMCCAADLPEDGGR